MKQNVKNILLQSLRVVHCCLRKSIVSGRTYAIVLKAIEQVCLVVTLSCLLHEMKLMLIHIHKYSVLCVLYELDHGHDCKRGKGGHTMYSC